MQSLQIVKSCSFSNLNNLILREICCLFLWIFLLIFLFNLLGVAQNRLHNPIRTSFLLQFILSIFFSLFKFQMQCSTVILIIIYLLQSSMRNISYFTFSFWMQTMIYLLLEPTFTIAPIWVTSPYIQAASKKPIDGDACNCAVGNNVTPTISITFTTSFSIIPNLAFGISTYIAEDSFYNQKFEVNRTNLGLTSFKIAVQIRQLTHIWTLEVRYIAISKQFPHHLNNFDNVPINYTFGPLTNISSSFNGETVFRNTINYTNQANAAGQTNNRFSLPLSNNKILLFLTSLFIEEESAYNSGVYLRIQTQILTTTTYRITARFSRKGIIEKLHFSMLIFDEVDIQSSGNYILVYNQITFNISQGFYSFPSQFLDNFMVGFLCFQSDNLRTTLNFKNTFIINGTFGMSKALSVKRGSYDPIQKYTFNIFYLKTWKCPNNTFFDLVSEQCYPCPLTQCVLCFNLTACQECNVSNHYYLSGSTCLQCDPQDNKFFNQVNLTCQTCSLDGCLNCSSMTICNTCNQNQGYVLNPISRKCYKCPSNLFPNITSYSCQSCTLTQCLVCSTLTSCLNCNTNNSYYLSNGQCSFCDPSNNQFINQTSLLCQTCSLGHCLSCASLQKCSVCNSSLNYLLNETNFLCQKCQIDYCTSCLSFLICQVCDELNGYILNQTSGKCYKCDPGLFPNLTSLTCDPCQLEECVACKTLTICQRCNLSNSFYLSGYTCHYCNPINNYFINQTTLSCQVCKVDNCLLCQSLTKCQICNQSSRYVLNQSSFECYECPLNLFPNSTSLKCQQCKIKECLQCSSLSKCQVCNTNGSYYLNDTLCSYCDSSLNLFINYSSLYCETCTIKSCLTCLSLNACLQCNSLDQYFLNQSNSLCQPCALVNCINCSSLKECYQCNQSLGYFINSATNLCQPCSLPGCIRCESLNTCLECDFTMNYGLDFKKNRTLCGPCNSSCTCDGYTNPWVSQIQSCSPLCGDGLIRLGQQCDDNNTESGDGCSSSCRVEAYFICDQGEPTSCNQTLFIHAQLIQFSKHSCNGLKALVKITPLLSVQQLAPTVNFNNQAIIIKDILQADGKINIIAQYTKDIANQQIQLKFSPGVTLNITYNPDIPSLRYDQTECKAVEDVTVFLKNVQIISYLILLFSLLSCKIIGLQLFGVLQLSYFTLTMQDFYVIYLAPLAKFRTFNGLNIIMIQQGTKLPQNFTKLNVVSSFINNCNIMLILLFAELLISALLYILSKFLSSERIKTVALRLLKQGFLTLVIFNIFNISYSAGVHWKYASPEDDGYLLSSIILYGTLIAVVLATFGIQIFSEDDYGEFRKKFKKNWICKSYIPLTIIYRIFLGLYTALKSDYNQGTLLILASTIAFMLYNIANFPFSQTIHNYRGTVCQITMSYILLASNYYRGMKMNTPIQIKGRQYTAAIIELLLIGVCLVFSFVALGYEIYKMLVKCKIKRRVVQITEQSIEGITYEEN